MFISEFNQFLTDIQVHHKNMIILGDFNIHINDTANHDSKIFIEHMESAGFLQHVTTSTHRAGNILDHVYTEEGGNVTVTSCKVMDFISDHNIIKCILNIPKENVTRKTITYRKFSQVDLKAFSSDLEFKLPTTPSLQDLVDHFEQKVSEIVDLHAPTRTRTLTIRHKNLWYTEEVRQLKRRVQKQERLWRRTRLNNHWQLLRKAHRQYTSLIRSTKIEKLSQKVNDCRGNLKELYKLFNSITGKKKENPMPRGSTDEELAEDFADHFLGKITTIRDALEHTQKYVPSVKETIKFGEFTELRSEEIRKIIMSMKTKSCELDCLPTFLLKAVIPKVEHIITDIINTSLQEGNFVNTWKTAVIRPSIKKPGLETTFNNYRPVSNVGFLSKVLEKAALYQLMEHCDTNNLLPDYQSAYRKSYSCETALVKLVDDLLWSMEKQQATALIAIDLSAAFDTVDHEILQSVLTARFGISNTALDWFSSYLYPRSCKVNVGEKYSNEKDLHFSVPQGSCMGPVLYLAYASTLQDVIPSHIDLHGYADDHAVKLSFKANDLAAQHDTINQLQRCLQDINEWMNMNRLKMNASKTEFIIFSSRQHLKGNMATQINVCEAVVERTQKIKYLGTTLDESLTMKDFVTSKCRTAMWNIQRIKNFRSILTQEACETLTLGLVISHLDFTNAVLTGIPDCDIKRLQRVQNIAAKLVVNNDENAHTCLKKLHWLPIKLRIKHKVLTLVYKCLNNDAPHYLKDLLVIDTPSRPQLRSNSTASVKLTVPFVRRTTFAARAFSVMGPKWWNSLPDSIKNSPCAETFKKHLKTHLFNDF